VKNVPRPGILAKTPLGPADHSPGVDVVGRVVPWADQTSGFVEAAVGEIGAEVAAAAAHGEVVTGSIADRIVAGTDDGPGGSSEAAPISVMRGFCG
jgi:hypothetical protein